MASENCLRSRFCGSGKARCISCLSLNAMVTFCKTRLIQRDLKCSENSPCYMCIVCVHICHPWCTRISFPALSTVFCDNFPKHRFINVCVAGEEEMSQVCDHEEIAMQWFFGGSVWLPVGVRGTLFIPAFDYRNGCQGFQAIGSCSSSASACSIQLRPVLPLSGVLIFNT